MDGILNINKPSGMTSHDVVYKIRRLLSEKKVGHTGTLDPDATGVLPICLGKATKIIQFLPDNEKGYEGTITLGMATDSLDSSGKVIEVNDTSHVELSHIERIFTEFIGEIDQIPPMVSAIKIQGERLYKLARQGKTVERKPRKIHIYDLELLDFRKSVQDSDADKVEVDFRVICSKGTYVRALARDIGVKLRCGGHLSKLIRTKSGSFELKDSIRLEDIQATPQTAYESICSIDQVLSFMPMLFVKDTARKRFLNGAPVEASDILRQEAGNIKLRTGDLIRVYDKDDALLGIGKAVTAYSPKVIYQPRAIICKALKVLKIT
jgi:tRNA pseudouridine55 synthase